MRKLVFTLSIMLSVVFFANAQAKGNAIGIRTGYSDSEISFQHALGDANRLELGLGTNYLWGATLTGVYQWVWDLSSLAPGFNWYAGGGAALGLHSSSSFGVGVMGQIGVEYNFEFPLQLSLDYRPIIFLVPAFHDSFSSACLGVRYRF